MLRFDWSAAAVGYSLAASGIVMAISQGGLTRVLIEEAKNIPTWNLHSEC
jgi:hypothetical protein